MITFIACIMTAAVSWTIGVKMGAKFAVKEMVVKTTGKEIDL